MIAVLLLRPALARRRRAAVLLSALALVGCGREPTDESVPTPPDDSAECAGDFDTFDPGMTKLAEPGDITVKLSRADPSPPVVRKDNVWWLELDDADGGLLSGAAVVVSPYMPAHQHGAAEVVVQEQGEGEYQLSPIALIMPGVWEIPVSVTPLGADTSETTFRFCIAER